ncbi:MAG: hypothetical protein AB1515_04310 [Nitrospirota bacterium]
MAAPGRRWTATGLAATAAILAGCPAVIPPDVRLEHRVRFVEPSFIREFVPAGGVAVLPFVGGAGPEGIRNDAAFELAQAYRRAFPKAMVLTKDELLSRLRPKGLDKTALQLIQRYEETQKLDPSLLIRLEQAVPVRYLAYGRLERFSERDVEGQRRKEVEFYSEVWDLPCKLVVWSGNASHRVSDSLQQEPTPMGDLFVGAATEMVAAIGPVTGKKSVEPAAC